jgi:hypothetical protein
MLSDEKLEEIRERAKAASEQLDDIFALLEHIDKMNAELADARLFIANHTGTLRLMATNLIPIEPQPPEGVEMHLLPYNELDSAHHAMTAGQGEHTEWYRCAAGVPEDIVLHEGKWCWVMPAGGEG